MDFFVHWASETWAMTLEAAPWLVGGFLIAGFIYVLLPTERVVAHLGRPGLGSVIKAALIGVPLPLCSCSVIPVAASIRRRGASRGATASFLVSTPESGVDSFAISYALLGPVLAVARPIAAFLSALLSGGLIAARERRQTNSAQSLVTLGQSSGTCCCCHGQKADAEADAGKNAPRPGIAAQTRQALHHGLVTMFRDLGHWLLLGFLLSGLFAALLPPDFFERTIGHGITPMLLMLVAGLPLYVCATSATPIAAALIATGLSPGAAIVFLLVGPATNMATLAVVGRELGRANLALYLVGIVVVALGVGYGVDLLVANAPLPVPAPLMHTHHEAGPLAWISAIVLSLLVANGLWQRWGRGRRRAASAETQLPQSEPA